MNACKEFNLEKMGRRRADVLSGGNKRKLSAAIALLGHPRLAVLDEPSCGLDPAARRALWDAISSAVCSSKASARGGSGIPSAVLLTTHSMEEAEALSSRLAILADGRMLTIGTGQQIKQRYGGCHELSLTLVAESAETLLNIIGQLGAGALRPETCLNMQSVGPLLDQDHAKRRAYSRARCVVRAQMETLGYVQASVLAEWWVQQSRGEAVEAFLCSTLGEGLELTENFGPHWRYRLPRGPIALPDVFHHLEANAQPLGIAEYTLSQASLEQIFNGMAQEAEAARG